MLAALLVLAAGSVFAGVYLFTTNGDGRIWPLVPIIFVAAVVVAIFTSNDGGA